jgi:hypothetical protein
MKKDYNKKKRVAIVALSLVAVCLAGGLFYYIRTMDGGGQPQKAPEGSPVSLETGVDVPEIQTETAPTPTIKEESSVLPTDSITESSSDSEMETLEESSPSAINESQVAVQKKPSDGKPKTAAEATPPAEPPKETEKEINSEKSDQNSTGDGAETSQPKGGDTNSEGAVYVPGFGYVQPPGTAEGSTSYTDGDWDKQIGTMQ